MLCKATLHSYGCQQSSLYRKVCAYSKAIEIKIFSMNNFSGKAKDNCMLIPFQNQGTQLDNNYTVFNHRLGSESTMFSMLALVKEATGFSLRMKKKLTAFSNSSGSIRQKGRGQTAFSLSHKSGSIHQRPLQDLVIHASELLHTT